ncbi:uncharacterized protein CTRU02_213256 [Colletotrichum truncatum]|uniref:Uncharacterized protein n=1 Tax=Colletotrichum truncatum TaxID=5467 RepID=A0ACC3YK69_COLTU|nr:uncharacterized protein CTRU02_12636 [Colletotrichum truncatum]KAF6784374.1 hypothetical protein CTRU02_12636 [Colletotrichum truncatum]
MRCNIHFLLATLAGLSAAQWDNNSSAPIELAPAPWTLKGTVYSVTLVPLSDDLPTKAFPPLERKHASATDGEYLGILGMIQIIRYTESPVGPYDELLIVPGFFKYNYTDAAGVFEEKKNVRVSRIYVSQKYTCWNGRTNWNIPKHLARFDWTENGKGETTVKVYPHDTTGDENESTPAKKPWFQAKFKPDLVSGLPFSTDLYKILGVNATLAQPPLPYANSTYGELAGTDRWATTVPGQFTDNASLGVFDLDQGDGDVENGQSTNAVGDEYFPNFWPGLLRFNAGIKLENATITFSDPVTWPGVKA